MLKSWDFFFVRNIATLTKQICLGVSKWLAWMYGGNHGNWLVVRNLGEGCSIGMCEADRGAHTHRRANDKPAVSLKSISYIIETTYYLQPSSGQDKRPLLYFFENKFSPQWCNLGVFVWDRHTDIKVRGKNHKWLCLQKGYQNQLKSEFQINHTKSQ